MPCAGDVSPGVNSWCELVVVAWVTVQPAGHLTEMLACVEDHNGHLVIICSCAQDAEAFNDRHHSWAIVCRY